MTNLPSGWEQKKFGDIFKVKYGKAIDKSLREDSARYPVVGSAGVMTYTKTPLTSEPTIVIGRKGNVGSIQVFKDGCYPIDTTYYMHSCNEFDLDFLTHLLTSLELVKLDSSTATPSLRREDLEDVRLVIPPLPEQHKIVEILEDHLSRLDAALADVKQAKVKATQFRRSLLQAAFTGNLGIDGTLLMKELPANWHRGKIGNYCLNVEKIDPVQLGRNTIKYIDIGALESNSSSLENVSTITTESAPGRARQLVRTGDSLFATVRPYMKKVAFITDPYSGEIASTGFCVLRPESEKLQPKFLFYFLQSNELLDQVLPLQRGVSYPAIRDNDVKNAIVPIPPLPEQHKIVEILEDHLSRLDASMALADAMEKQSVGLRRSLLQAAFTGQLTKEVASV